MLTFGFAALFLRCESLSDYFYYAGFYTNINIGQVGGDSSFPYRWPY